MARSILSRIWDSLGGDAVATKSVQFCGKYYLRSAFAVSDLAAGAVAAAALAAAEYAQIDPALVRIDRRLASLWFGWSFEPNGWKNTAEWDPIAGNYETSDGWIRLHTNAPHHLTAALSVLNAPPERPVVAAAITRWQADDLEKAILSAGGCAATMRSLDDWSHHPQGRAVTGEPLVWCERTAGGLFRRIDSPDRPLKGLRVLDLTRVYAGPVCTRALAGLGAEVLRIDPPSWNEPMVVPEMTLGKRCAWLDARKTTSRKVLRDLLKDADILVHGYRPGAMDSIGLGASDRAQLRPGLVDVSLDAYGWTGPWAGRRGFDSLVQMSSGIAAEGMRRFKSNKPTPLPVQALDHAAGWIMAAAVLRGLVERQSGHGWTARTSLARVAALLIPTVSDAYLEGELDKPSASDFAEAQEQTVWGPIRRLRPPATMGNTVLRWDLPACPLGSAKAQWQSQ